VGIGGNRLRFQPPLGTVAFYGPFSRRTPLNFFGLFFTAMNSPDFLSRLVQAGLPITFDLRYVRFFTAPLLKRWSAGHASCRCDHDTSYFAQENRLHRQRIIPPNLRLLFTLE
jgi:hypothetical protein